MFKNSFLIPFVIREISWNSNGFMRDILPGGVVLYLICNFLKQLDTWKSFSWRKNNILIKHIRKDLLELDILKNKPAHLRNFIAIQYNLLKKSVWFAIENEYGLTVRTEKIWDFLLFLQITKQHGLQSYKCLHVSLLQSCAFVYSKSLTVLPHKHVFFLFF